MSGIFISYRRQDTSYIAGRLHDRLAAHFGPDQIFRDIDTMKPGVDFGERIDEAVGSCDALVVVIGDQWLSISTPKGRRIDDPKDWVRLEIAVALKRNTLVIPVLVENAQMPAPAELPPALRKLARINALELSDARWDYDVNRLIEVLDDVVKASPPEPKAKPAPIPAPPAPVPDQAPPAPANPSAPAPPPWAGQSSWGTPRPEGASGPAPAPIWSVKECRSEPAVDDRPMIPTWGKAAIALVAVMLVAIPLVLVLGKGGNDSPGSSGSPDTASGRSGSETTAANVREITGSWSGENGRLTLTVEKVQLGTAGARVFVSVNNGTSETVFLPTQSFSAIDNTGHSYKVDVFSKDWPTDVPPGVVRGVLDLTEPIDPAASTMKVGWATIFGPLNMRGGIFAGDISLN